MIELTKQVSVMDILHKKRLFNNMYQYFIQPQINAFTGTLIGYELLIRQYRNNRWSLPRDFSTIPIKIQTDLLKSIALDLSLKINSLSFNLNRYQFLNDSMKETLIKVQHQVYPTIITVELTEEETELQNKSKLLHQIKKYYDNGIRISIDDVSTGENTYANIIDFFPYVFEIKFAIQNMNIKKYSILEKNLLFWKKVSQEHHLNLVVEGIEKSCEDKLLNQLNIPYRQGFFYGRPHLFLKK